MMKFLVGFCILAIAAPTVFAVTCSVEIKDGDEVPTEWIDMTKKCVDAMREQIRKEIYASYQYLAMGAHFSRDTINRPGFAELFFKSAKEEREHGSKLIEYLSMRGDLTSDVTELIKTPPVIRSHTWASGANALEDALILEHEVTTSIRNLIDTCERATDKNNQKHNDYHLVDYLTGVYLEEQLHGQRELAGKLSTLRKLMNGHHGDLGEFLFDKEL